MSKTTHNNNDDEDDDLGDDDEDYDEQQSNEWKAELDKSKEALKKLQDAKQKAELIYENEVNKLKEELK